MVQILVWFFGAQWLLGLAGMFVSRGVFDVERSATVFDAFSSMWFAGGLGFVLLGAASLLFSPAPTRPEAR